MGQKPSRPIVAQPQVNVSGHIPWDPISTMIGGGYDVQRYRTQQTAFIETPDIKHQNSKCAVDMKYTSKVVRTHEELEEGIRLSCGLSVPVGLGAANEASLDYIRSIKCSATSMTTIISCEIGFPSEKCVSRPRLSSEADALLARDPKMFTEQYGQYFVSGQQRRSTFLAICSHNSSSKEQLDDFKVKLGANFQVASFEAAADYMQSAKSSKLTTTIEIQTSGYQGDKVLIFMTTDIMPILRAFLKNYAPTPYLALMTDYSCIDIRASRQHESLTLPHDLDDAFQKVCVLEIRAKSCTRLGAQKVLPEISNLRQDITRVHLSASDWRVRLSEWEEKIRASQDLVDEWWERQALLERAAKRSAEQWSRSVNLAMILTPCRISSWTPLTFLLARAGTRHQAKRNWRPAFAISKTSSLWLPKCVTTFCDFQKTHVTANP